MVTARVAIPARVHEPVTLSPDNPDFDDDFQAAEFALGLAEGADLAAAQQRARSDNTFAAHVAAWQERFVAMTDDIAPVTPPRRVKKAVVKTLFSTPPIPLLDRLWVWKGLTLASLVAAAYFAFPLVRPTVEVPSEIYATQLRGEASGLEVLAVLDPARGDLALRRIAGGAPEGRVLELWALLPEQAPVSLGVLPEGDVTRVTLPAEFIAQISQLTLAISDEPPQGAPQGVPTGAILAVGAVEEL